MTTKQDEEEKHLTPDQIKNIEKYINWFTKLASGIGLPGTFLILIFFGIGMYGTKDQKIEIIDKYILFHETQGFVVVVIFLTLLCLAVYLHYGNGLKRCIFRSNEQKREIERYQAQLIPKKIRK